MLIKPAEEQPPKVTIHLPPTPVIEAPPPLPTPKLKVQRTLSIKANVAAVKSPLTPVTIPPKIKLPMNGSRVDVTPRLPSLPPATPFMGRRRESGSSFSKPTKKVEIQRPPNTLPKSRSGGMDFYDEKACKAAVKKLQNHKRSYFFRQPVDPVRDRAPQ